MTRFAVGEAVLKGKREDPVDGTPKWYQEIYTQCWAADPMDRPNMDLTIQLLTQEGLYYFFSYVYQVRLLILIYIIDIDARTPQEAVIDRNKHTQSSLGMKIYSGNGVQEDLLEAFKRSQKGISQNFKILTYLMCFLWQLQKQDIQMLNLRLE
jgi:hypothetical protein